MLEGLEWVQEKVGITWLVFSFSFRTLEYLYYLHSSVEHTGIFSMLLLLGKRRMLWNVMEGCGTFQTWTVLVHGMSHGQWLCNLIKVMYCANCIYSRPIILISYICCFLSWWQAHCIRLNWQDNPDLGWTSAQFYWSPTKHNWESSSGEPSTTYSLPAPW